MNNLYDTVIIGSGSAGSIIANRLSKDESRNILVIEAGNDYPTIDSLPENVFYGHGNLNTTASNDADPSNWSYRAESTKGGPTIRIPRGKIIGGSSSINAQIFLRGIRDDYDRWAEFGNDKWTFEEVLPYFLKLENDLDYGENEYHGSQGYMKVKRFPKKKWDPVHDAFYQSCIDYGFEDCPDNNKPDSTGVGPLAFNQINGVRQSTSLTYLEDVRHKPNINIKSNSYVKKVLFDKYTAIGLEIITDKEEYKLFCDDIILCAGAIESPKLLLNSGVGDPNKFSNYGIKTVLNLPGVGMNLRDHPMTYVAWETRDSFVEPSSNEPRAKVALRYTSKNSQWKNDMIVYMGSGTRLMGNPEIPEGIKANLTLNLAESAGEVSLNNHDPSAYPNLFYNYLGTENDTARLMEGIRILNEIGNHKEFQKHVSNINAPDISVIKDDNLLKKWLYNKMVTGHHSSGTCKMGNDPMAVVDQNGAVIGLENIKVVDASIMPDCIRANTNATVMVMAERIIDLW
tara:strand:+ start:3901 stop:5439 length:1539 start_codon:yes stop_codon:yes gene_type:complete